MFVTKVPRSFVSFVFYKIPPSQNTVEVCRTVYKRMTYLSLQLLELNLYLLQLLFLGLQFDFQLYHAKRISTVVITLTVSSSG